MDPNDFHTLNDADLDAQIAAEDTEVDTAPEETPAPTPTGEEPAAVAPPEPVAPAPVDPATSDDAPKDDGPGDLKVALQREREQRRVLAEQLEAERQQRLAIEQQRQQDAAAREDAAIRAHYEELLIDDPEQAARFLESVQQQRTQQMQGQYQQQLAVERISMSVDLARAQYGDDYDRQIDKLYAKFGQAAVIQMAAQQANPAQWAYNLAREIQTPEEREASIQQRVQQEVAKALSDLQAKQQPPAIKGPKTVAHLTAAPGSPGVERSEREMSDDELDALIKDD